MQVINIPEPEGTAELIAELESIGCFMGWYGIPDYMKPGIARYVMLGIPPGDFLTAVIDSDLFKAARYADDNNARLLYEYVKFFINSVPGGCHGGPQYRKDWIEGGGLKGRS